MDIHLLFSRLLKETRMATTLSVNEERDRAIDAIVLNVVDTAINANHTAGEQQVFSVTFPSAAVFSQAALKARLVPESAHYQCLHKYGPSMRPLGSHLAARTLSETHIYQAISNEFLLFVSCFHCNVITPHLVYAFITMILELVQGAPLRFYQTLSTIFAYPLYIV
jgi:hypothetical protein